MSIAATCSRSLIRTEARDVVSRSLIRLQLTGSVTRRGARQYASSSSRLPGSARPSRVPIKHTSTRHSTPSHAHKSKEGLLRQSAESLSSPQASHEKQLSEAAVQSDLVASGSDDAGKARDVATPATMESILGQDTLVVTREIEMMNIFIGFEQANKYALNTAGGETVGYIAEVEEGLLGGSMKRQLMRTHRPFKATIMDTSGNIVMIIKRNFTWINSYVKMYTLDPETREEVLLGEVHQKFHVIRRKYELFINRGGEAGQEDLEQFADIDEGLWAWDFMLKNDTGRPLGAISRNFRGFGRELFTDTGQYVVTFDPSTMTSDLRIEDGQDKKKDSSLSNSTSGRELMTSGPARALSIQERAIALATAVSADFDYFSRHSEGTHGSMLPWIWMGGGSGTPKEGEPAPTAEGQNVPSTTQGQDSSGVQAPPPTPGSDAGGFSGAGTAAGYDAMGGGGTSQSQQPYDASADFDSPPPPSSTSGGDMGQGAEEVWGSSDPFGGANTPPEQSADNGWGWGNSGGGDGGGGGGGGWLDGFFDS